MAEFHFSNRARFIQPYPKRQRAPKRVIGKCQISILYDSKTSVVHFSLPWKASETQEDFHFSQSFQLSEIRVGLVKELWGLGIRPIKPKGLLIKALLRF
jgi:hypothetical protein